MPALLASASCDRPSVWRESTKPVWPPLTAWRKSHAAVVLARAPVNPSPGIFVAPEVLTAPGDPAADPFPQISQEAQIADRVQHLFWNELQREGLDGEWHLFASNTVGFLDLAKSFDLTILGQLSPQGRSIGFPPRET